MATTQQLLKLVGDCSLSFADESAFEAKRRAAREKFDKLEKSIDDQYEKECEEANSRANLKRKSAIYQNMKAEAGRLQAEHDNKTRIARERFRKQKQELRGLIILKGGVPEVCSKVEKFLRQYGSM